MAIAPANGVHNKSLAQTAKLLLKKMYTKCQVHEAQQHMCHLWGIASAATYE